METMQTYFEPFRRQIIGIDQRYRFAGGDLPILYADWAASGRLYAPIERFISSELGPYVANTHTESTLTGTLMTSAYHQAHEIIKRHVNASPDDVLLFAGFGMTAVINKFQRILGLRIPERFKNRITLCEDEKPLVIITHMEHHSNQTTWEECCCDIVILCKRADGRPNLDHLKTILETQTERRLIIGSFTACSNVTGIITDYYEMAALMHAHGRLCFVDFSASAPYVKIDMHPPRPECKLDAVFFSPHKFLGGPGSSGVILFDKDLYRITVPDHPGGGTVVYTTPWGQHRFFDDIEVREDGGTPGFLQAIKAALAIHLKETMQTDRIMAREHAMTDYLLNELCPIDGLSVLEGHNHNRIGFVSFYTKHIHHNLFVRLLNDRFGIQCRGGCLCAGTYAHVLLRLDPQKSRVITDHIDRHDLSIKPGWVRISLHPTMTDAEVEYINDAVRRVMANYQTWQKDYRFIPSDGDFEYGGTPPVPIDLRSVC